MLEAFQLLLGILQLPGCPLQLPGQLLVGEFQLGVLSLGFVLVVVQGGALAFQLERNGGVVQRGAMSELHPPIRLAFPSRALLPPPGGREPMLLPLTALKPQSALSCPLMHTHTLLEAGRINSV